MRLSPGWLLCNNAITSASSSMSIQSWHAPGPSGPSRITVGGTTSHPVASDTRYAPTSRPASVPSGKSHSGRSPATGLYTQVSETAPCVTTAYSVVFEASTSRPSMARSPSVKTVRTSAALRSKLCSVTTVPSVRVVAVGACADVALGIQRLPAELARWPPRSNDRERTLRERARYAAGDAHPQQVRTFGVVVTEQRRVGRIIGVIVGLVAGDVADGQRLNDHSLRLGIPAETERANPELLHDRLVKWQRVVEFKWRDCGHRRRPA